MAQANIEHSISLSLPTVCAALTIKDCRALYFATVAAAEGFVGGVNRPNTSDAAGNLLEEYASQIEGLYESIAAEVESKVATNKDDASAKLEILMDFYIQRTSNQERAAQLMIELLPLIGERGRH